MLREFSMTVADWPIGPVTGLGGLKTAWNRVSSGKGLVCPSSCTIHMLLVSSTTSMTRRQVRDFDHQNSRLL